MSPLWLQAVRGELGTASVEEPDADRHHGLAEAQGQLGRCLVELLAVGRPGLDQHGMRGHRTGQQDEQPEGCGQPAHEWPQLAGLAWMVTPGAGSS